MRILMSIAAFVAPALLLVACSSDGGTATDTSVPDAGPVKPPTTDAGKADSSPPPPAPTFTIGGTVTGLQGSGLVLENNGGDDLAVKADGTFTFTTKVPAAEAFKVTIKAQPSAPSQTCEVTGGTGTVAAGNVSSVTVNCTTNKFTVGGTAAGVVGTGLVIQNKLGSNLPLNMNGSFAFPTAITSGDTYAVTVKAQPTGPSQTCAVTKGAGTVGAANVTDVAVTCTTDTFKVGGTLTGLTGGTLVLQQKGGDNLSLTADGAFSFATKVASGKAYDVTVLAQPADHFCSVKTGTGAGSVAAADITSVVIGCTPFKNPSFEAEFTGWTLARVFGAPAGGGITTITSGTTLNTGDTVQDLISAAPHLITFTSPALPETFTALAAGDGTKIGILFSSNNSSQLKASQVLALSSAVTTLKFNVQYSSGIALDDNAQFVRVALYDAGTNTLLVNAFKAGTGAPLKGAMTTMTTDVSAYAGTSVRLELELYGKNFPLYAGFDAFALP